MVEARYATEIVLVEDDDDDAAAALRLAERSPVPVSLTVVRDGRAALALLRGRARLEGGATPPLPQAVLLDIGLPGIDGIEVLRLVKAEPGLHDIPAIVLTGSQDEQYIRRGQALGAHGHLAKPLGLQDLVWIATSVRNYWERISRLSQLTVR